LLLVARVLLGQFVLLAGGANSEKSTRRTRIVFLRKELLMKLARMTRLWLVLTAVVALSLTTTAVYAHERREVGEYQFVVGFMVEPALEGLKNGVSLEVTQGDAPVEGLEETFQVEITHVPSGASKTMSLRTVFGEPGHYTADLIPQLPATTASVSSALSKEWRWTRPLIQGLGVGDLTTYSLPLNSSSRKACQRLVRLRQR
jgi:hypothetical protein